MKAGVELIKIYFNQYFQMVKVVAGLSYNWYELHSRIC